MSLPTSRMNAVLQLSHRVFEKRAEIALKSSEAVQCAPGIVISLNGIHFARNGNHDVFLVIELGVESIALPTPITGELWYEISLGAIQPLTIVISFEYDHMVSSVPIPPGQVPPSPDIPDILIPLQDSFGSSMVLQGGPPELAVVGGGKTLAIGLEISQGENVDRNYFRNYYSENLLQRITDDWALQIESNLMHIKAGEDFNNMNLDNVPLPDFAELVRYDMRRACWSGQCLNWQYFGWQNYVSSNYIYHPVWLAAEPLVEVEVCVWNLCRSQRFGLYWLAWADFEVAGGQLFLDAYIFEIGIRSGITAYLTMERDVPPIQIGSAAVGDDFEITRFGQNYPEQLLVFGRDTSVGFPGEAQIEAPNDVAVDFRIIWQPVLREYGVITCMVATNVGELENGDVISHFEICNLGGAPLWICSITLDDPDQVFRLRRPATPFMIDPGDCTPVDALMSVPDDDHSGHEAQVTIQSNDPNQAVITIPMHGIKVEEVDPDSPMEFCFNTPWKIDYTMLESIARIVFESVKMDLPQIKLRFPIPDPEPLPCPQCGYFLDIVIGAPVENLSFEVYDSSGELVTRSQAFRNIHLFSIPLRLSKRLRISMRPESYEGQGIIKFGLSRIVRVGMFMSEDKLIQLATNRAMIFALNQKGIDVVNISDPVNPFVINRLDLEDIRNIEIHKGFLYAITDTDLQVFDINDPYNPKPYHSILVRGNAGFHVSGNQLVIHDSNKLSVYQLVSGTAPQWVSEFRPKEGIIGLTKTADAYTLAVEGGSYVLKSMTSDEFIRTKFSSSKEVERRLTKTREEEPASMLPLEFIVQDDYLLRIMDEKKNGFEILQKTAIPYRFRKEVTEGIESLKKQTQ